VKISLLCFDLSSNAFGRTALLAQALARNHRVEILGPTRTGEVWPPMRRLDIPIKAYPWKRYPGFLPVLNRMVRDIDGDVVFACKLRPTSFGVGVLHKRRTGKPLIVDIDDWELGFFYHSGFWGTLGRFLNLSNPNGLPYTWLMERWVKHADAVVVSNRFLQERFHGERVYHCRDTGVLDPAKLDPAPLRKMLALEGKKTVLFLGTPREHKGVGDLIRAFTKMTRADAHLVLIGDADPAHWGVGIDDLRGRITTVPQIPFAELGRYLGIADVVVIPQRQTTDTVGQIPAKLFDAMAMGKPIIATRVADIPDVLGGCGYLVEPGDVEELARTLEYVLAHEDEARAKGRAARDRCVLLYDIRGMEETLARVVRDAVAKNSNPGRSAT
jgi:glycosyltransferase involved in cell wall biosynthesis